MKGNRKKSFFCMANIHSWRNGPGSRCTDCGDWDYLFAPREAFEAFFMTEGKPKKSHRLDTTK